MTYEPKSIGDHIECLARLTGAPQSFVMQIKDLFSKKGISLDEDAEPYQDALEEAFKREEAIRASSCRVKDSVSRLQNKFSRIGQAYVKQLEANKGRASHSDTQQTETAIPGGDHRSLVTRRQTECLPLVPGPDELQ